MISLEGYDLSAQAHAADARTRCTHGTRGQHRLCGPRTFEGSLMLLSIRAGGSSRSGLGGPMSGLGLPVRAGRSRSGLEAVDAPGTPTRQVAQPVV